jgi:protein-disulfide isomerase
MGADAGKPGLAKSALLATVGGRKITVASAATRLDGAAFAVRRGLYFDERAAFENLAHARLLAAEAGRRGVTPEALEKQNVNVEEGHSVEFLGEMPAPPVLALDLSRGTSRGDPAAAVTVVEWADFECQHCSRMWTILEETLAPYGDRVRYVYLNWPLPFHEFAQKAAEAALAARAQGKFFAYASVLFRNQKALDPASLKKYASDLGLDAARFAADLDGGRFAGEVLLEKRAGIRAGVLGTPFVFVNGVWLRWDKSDVAGVRALVDAAFAAAPAKPSAR